MLKRKHWTGAGLAFVAVALVGCGTSTNSSVAVANQSTQASLSNLVAASSNTVKTNEAPVTPEKNPTGDIPDTQDFVQYGSPTGGYHLDVPEGWSRTTAAGDVSFVDKLDGVKVNVTNGKMKTASQLRNDPILSHLGRAVRIKGVKDVQLSAGPAVLVDYTSNSDLNPVTGKQIRLEDNAYFLFKNGKVATLTLWAPLGADNVDQWNKMANSFGRK